MFSPVAAALLLIAGAFAALAASSLAGALTSADWRRRLSRTFGPTLQREALERALVNARLERRDWILAGVGVALGLVALALFVIVRTLR